MTCMCERLCRWNLWKSGGHGSKSGEEDLFLVVFRPPFSPGVGSWCGVGVWVHKFEMNMENPFISPPSLLGEEVSGCCMVGTVVLCSRPSVSQFHFSLHQKTAPLFSSAVFSPSWRQTDSPQMSSILPSPAHFRSEAGGHRRGVAHFEAEGCRRQNVPHRTCGRGS